MIRQVNKFQEFWTEWNEFSVLRLKNAGKCRKNDLVIWDKCRRTSMFSDYENSVFENNEDQWKKRVLKEKLKLKKFIENFKWKKMIKSILEWKVWNELVDLDNNLKWLKWSTIFCSKCMINRMMRDSAWPNWNEKMTRSSVF